MPNSKRKSLEDLVKMTEKVRIQFGGPDWSPEVRTLDLMEEVGELCNAILVQEGHKHKKRARAELADSLCDVLYNILLLSSLYKINLEQEYQQMLERLIERIKNKEFHDD